MHGHLGALSARFWKLGLARTYLVMLPLLATTAFGAAGGATGTAAAADPDTPEHDPSLQALAAFARVYGYVRFFHPSDEAARVDWDQFAITGAREVSAVSDLDDLREVLEGMFLPLAPTIQFLLPGDEATLHHRARASEGPVLAWQHAGVGVSSAPFYQSLRLNRPDRHGGGGMPSMLLQQVRVSPYAGREFKLRFRFRTEFHGIGGGVAPLLEVSRQGGLPGFSHFPLDRPLTTDGWAVHEVSGRLDPDAESLTVGLFTQGPGDAWFADPELFIRDDDDEWRSASTFRPALLEVDQTLDTAWSFQGETHVLRSDAVLTTLESPGVHIEHQGADRLFEEHPTVGETFESEVAPGLRVVVPLALTHDEAASHGGTRPTSEAATDALSSSDSLEDPAIRLAGVVIAWNILRHFYPYPDEVEVDWEVALFETLEAARVADAPLDYLRGLERMLARLDDGHARVSHPLLAARVPLPLRFALAEGQVVIEAAADTTRLRRGDVLLAIDGVPAVDVLREEKSHRSGSPHFRQRRALGSIGAGAGGSYASLDIRRGPRQWTESVRRERAPVSHDGEPGPITEVSPGIFYVDMMRSGGGVLADHMSSLASADGVILDSRGFPASGAYSLFAHLIDQPLGWIPMCVLKTIRPEAPGSEGCLDAPAGGDVPPQAPLFDGEVVVLIDERAYSTPESYLKLVDHHRAATLVGRPTAGANGNYNWVHLPGGVQIFWTGMRVTRLDGSPHHVVGVRPEILVERTIDAIREGRDEDIEAAVDVIHARRNR